uniref:Uncharacterized protein n=1 Tax=Arundo donax TaxID=35708 RepID=A0A0A8Y2A4_ARUDO
MTLRHRTRRR